MYDNIGRKIKNLAEAIFIIATILAVIMGIALTFLLEDIFYVGLIVLVVGPIVAWISSWLLYGFGELVDKVCDIERNTRGEKGKSEAQLKVDYEKIREIEKLRSQGLITEEEYQQAIQKVQEV